MMSEGSLAGGGLPDPGDPRTLYVVDISGYVFRAYHALPPLSNSGGEPTHAVLGVTSMLLKLINERRPALLAVAMDSRTKPFRHAIYDAYKANRPPAPPDLKQQMERVGQVVEAFDIAVFQQDGMEADDIIASLVRRAEEHGLKAVIVSADKDLLQLVGDRVWMFDSMRDRVFGPAETEQRMGVPPHQVRDLLALVGDSSDNIPGVPSVGLKTAAALLSEHGDLDGVYRDLDTIKRKSLRTRLEENRETAYLSRRLVTLRDDLDIGFDEERLVFASAVSKRLIDLLKELEFTRLLAQIDTEASNGDPAEGEGAPDRSTDGSSCRLLRDEKEISELFDALGAVGRVSLFLVIDRQLPINAELLGVALAWRAASGKESEIETAYIPADNRQADAAPSQKAVIDALKPFLQDGTLPKVCADTKREAAALARHGIDLEGVAFDTNIASYLLDPERRAHTLKDVARAELDLELEAQDRLFPGKKSSQTRATQTALVDREDLIEPAVQMAGAALLCAEKMQARLVEAGCDRLMREVEIPLAGILASMELCGIQIDSAALVELSRQIQQQLVQLEARCKELAGRDFNVNSPRQLETILFDELRLPVVKKTKSARSTDRDTLEELAFLHELPVAVLEYRTLAKLKNTYLDTLPEQVDPRSGRIHTEFHQDVTATGRLSSSDPNLQNIPVRTEIGRSIRNAFIARQGWEILSADYSQIELRVLAHLSGDAELLEAFNAGQDIHARTARAIFGVDESGVTRQMRAQAKTVNYAVIYGQTQFALARNLRIEQSQARRYIEAFFKRYAGVDAYMKRVVEEGRQTGFVRTLYGRQRPVPDLNSGNRVRRQQAERVARNTPIQGTAADIIKMAMVAIDGEMKRQGLQGRMLLTVHDELVFEAPPEEKEKLGRLVRARMQNVVALDVPLLVDLGWGRTWGQAH